MIMDKTEALIFWVIAGPFLVKALSYFVTRFIGSTDTDKNTNREAWEKLRASIEKLNQTLSVHQEKFSNYSEAAAKNFALHEKRINSHSEKIEDLEKFKAVIKNHLKIK